MKCYPPWPSRPEMRHQHKHWNCHCSSSGRQDLQHEGFSDWQRRNNMQKLWGLQTALQLVSQTLGQWRIIRQRPGGPTFIIEVALRDHALTYWKDGDKMDALLQKDVQQVLSLFTFHSTSFSKYKMTYYISLRIKSFYRGKWFIPYTKKVSFISSLK